MELFIATDTLIIIQVHCWVVGYQLFIVDPEDGYMLVELHWPIAFHAGMKVLLVGLLLYWSVLALVLAVQESRELGSRCLHWLFQR